MEKGDQKIKDVFNVKAERAILAIDLEKIALNSSESGNCLPMKQENLSPERCSVQ